MYGVAQARYASDATQTASPARLLTMLYDRLVADLTAGEEAMRQGDIEATGARLGRALEILLELHATLDLAAWPEGQALADLYVWMIGEVMRSRVSGDADRVAGCLALAEPLRQAWHQASQAAAAGSTDRSTREAGAAAFGGLLDGAA